MRGVLCRLPFSFRGLETFSFPVAFHVQACTSDDHGTVQGKAKSRMEAKSTMGPSKEASKRTEADVPEVDFARINNGHP